MLARLLKTVSFPAVLAVIACATTGQFKDDETTVVQICSQRDPVDSCDYFGLVGLQEAIDQSTSDRRILIKTGTYTPTSYRDVPFQDLHVRGAVVVRDRKLSIEAEQGARLVGSAGFPLSAIVIEDSTVQISGLTISGFHYAVAEDDTYDGHGIFTINSDVSLDGVVIEGVAKMALTGREAGRIVARNLTINKSHLGVWLEETAAIDLIDSEIIASESAAVAAYGASSARVENSLIKGNQDDGLYTEDTARIISRETTLQDNSPFGARASGESVILICGGEVSGNAEDYGEEDAGRVYRNEVDMCLPG